MITYFPDRQFVITTHDEVWAKNLVSEGVITRENSIHFIYWSINEGSVVTFGQNIWRDCKNKAQTDLSSASAFFRREMECYFETACDKLKARIRYNDAHRWDYGQYMSSAYAELLYLIKKAKQEANKFSLTEKVKFLESWEQSLKDKNTILSRENWVTNILVHHNPSYVISKIDLLAAVSSMEEFCKDFECPNCHNLVSAVYEGAEALTLYCRCGQMNFSLKQ